MKQGVGKHCAVLKMCLFLMEASFPLLKHVGNCGQAQKTQACEKYALRGHEVERRQNPRDVAVAKEKVLLKKGASWSMFMTMRWEVAQVIHRCGCR